MSKIEFTTETGSVYVIADGHLSRIVGGSGALRRDGEAIEVIYMEPLEIGNSAILELNLRQDGVSTWRTTSRVTEIKELS